MVNDNSLLFFYHCRMSRISLGITLFDTIQFEQRHTTHNKTVKKTTNERTQNKEFQLNGRIINEEEEEEHQQQKYKYKRTNERTTE